MKNVGTCTVCKQLYGKWHKTSRFCSKSCRMKAYHAGRRGVPKLCKGWCLQVIVPKPGLAGRCYPCHRRYCNLLRELGWVFEPAQMTFDSISRRVGAGNYRHIRNLITVGQLETLWERDKAWRLKKPSIDRIDSAGDYTFENCRYIEHAENSRRAHIGRCFNDERDSQGRFASRA